MGHKLAQIKNDLQAMSDCFIPHDLLDYTWQIVAGLDALC